MQISFNHIQKNCKTIKDIQKLEISYAEASASVSYPLGETKRITDPLLPKSPKGFWRCRE